jgi:hypothetical protein
MSKRFGKIYGLIDGAADSRLGLKVPEGSAAKTFSS